MPETIPTYFLGMRLQPCQKCHADVWTSLGDRDCGDWDEEVFKCGNCGNIIHLELPD